MTFLKHFKYNFSHKFKCNTSQNIRQRDLNLPGQITIIEFSMYNRLERVAVRAEAIAMRASDALLKVVAVL